MIKTEIINQRILDNRKVILQTIKETDVNGYEYTHNKIILPYLTDDELLARYKRIKPIVSIDKLYYYLKKYDINMMRNQAYTWNINEDIRGKVDMTDAKTLDEFSCYHTYDYAGFFKPTMAEVLQQFPDELLNEANAFYMTSAPETVFDLNMQSEIVNARCHQSTIKALKLKNNK